MCSVVAFPGLNPACSFRSISSAASVMRIMTTLQNTLLGIESNVTPPPDVAICQIPIFWYLDSVLLCPFPWTFLLFPYVKEQRLENVTGKLGVSFKKLCRNPILARRLVVLQGLNGIKNFLWSWWVYPRVQIFLGWWNVRRELWFRSIQSTLHLDPAQMSKDSLANP